MLVIKLFRSRRNDRSPHREPAPVTEDLRYICFGLHRELCVMNTKEAAFYTQKKNYSFLFHVNTDQ